MRLYKYINQINFLIILKLNIMNNIQISQFNMSSKVDEVMNNNISIWAKDKVLIEIMDKVKVLRSNVKAAELLQKTPIKGITKEKSMYRHNLSDTLVIMLGIICSYATKTKNPKVYEQFNVSDSNVKRMSDNNIKILIEETEIYISENKDALKPFGLTDELIKQNDTEIKNYNNYVIKPIEAKAKIAEGTETIKKSLKELMDTYVTWLDKSMKQYSKTYPTFYGEYIEARYIYDMPTHHYSIKICATDEETGEPLYNVCVKFKKFKAGTEIASKVKSTSKKGICEERGLETGLWVVTAEKNFYEIYNKEIDIEPGIMYKLDIKLKKIK